MSNLEDSKNSSVYSKDFDAMVNGSIATPVFSNFYVGVSKVIGVVRKTALGVVGNPSITSLVGANAGSAQATTITLKSSNAGDLSVYTLYWTNESSVNLSVLPC